MKKTTCIALGVLLLAVGCGKKIEEKLSEKITEKVIEHASKGKAKADISKHSMTIKSEEGTVTGGPSATIPQGFPSDVFLFKPADVFMAAELSKGYSVGLKTEKDVASVTEAYKKAMVDNGWKQKTALDMGGKSMLAYEKENRLVNIGIGTRRNETTILINIPAEKSNHK